VKRFSLGSERRKFCRYPNKGGRLVMRRIVILSSMLALTVALSAPSFVSALEKQPQIKNEIVMKAGKKVHLFHSGTADVKKEICLKDVIPVYRETMAGGHSTVKEVGKVKVLSYAGEHYFEAEIVSGEIKIGDIAKKETASCLIQPAK
jgi:hypothetical protein